VASYQQTVLADNPVMYLRLNETVGTTAADTSGNGHAGTYTGAWTLGVAAGGTGLGTAISSAGATGIFVDIPSSAALDITGDVTLEAWINTTQSGGSQYIMSKGQTDASHGSYGMYLDLNGKIVFTCTEVSLVLTGTSAHSLNTWYHIACTRSGNTWTIYTNGVADGTTSNAQAISATARNYRISGVVEQAGTFFPFTGAIDEVAVYNTALSAAAIAAHYAARNTSSSGNAGTGSPPGTFVAALVQARNEERKAARQEQQQTPARHRTLDYRRKRGATR
jgi:concanavalin A-like lectin/glucanase superfamily protein